MRNIKLTLEYDGTGFEGWQFQPGKHRSVQGEIERAFLKIFTKKVRLIASGRTDSGVHAYGQVANCKIKSKLPAAEIQKALNGNLPRDIVVLDVTDAPAAFHAQYSVRSKIYRYTILNRPTRCARLRQFCLHVPYPLNVPRMKQEARALIGRKDFRSFMVSDPKKELKPRGTVRTVHGITIKRIEDFITIDIEADGFLYKMVRSIIGTLIEVGHGRLPKGSVKEILKRKDRRCAGYTAKPHGLCLLTVKYKATKK